GGRGLRRVGAGGLDQVLARDAGFDRARRVDLQVDAGEVVPGQLPAGHPLPGAPIRRQVVVGGEHLQLSSAGFVLEQEQSAALWLGEEDQLGFQQGVQQGLPRRVSGGGELQRAFGVVGRRGQSQSNG